MVRASSRPHFKCGEGPGDEIALEPQTCEVDKQRSTRWTSSADLFVLFPLFLTSSLTRTIKKQQKIIFSVFLINSLCFLFKDLDFKMDRAKVFAVMIVMCLVMSMVIDSSS